MLLNDNVKDENPYGEAYQPQSAEYPRDVELRFIILNQHAGGIIGKSGHYIKKIRQESDADFQLFPQVKDAYIRLGEIKGPSAQVFIALRILCEKLQELQGEDESVKLATGEDLAFTFLLERKNCGCIIGSKGAKISATRKSTGANIKISSEPLPESSEKSVEIKGQKEQVLQVLNIMLEQISSNEKHHRTVRKFEIHDAKPMYHPADPYSMYGGGPQHGGMGHPGRSANNGWISSTPRAHGGPGPYGPPGLGPGGHGGHGGYGQGYHPYGRPQPNFRNNPYRGRGKNQWNW